LHHHQQNFRKDPDDPTRCDNIIRAQNTVIQNVSAGESSDSGQNPCGGESTDSSQTPLGGEISDAGQNTGCEVPLIQFPVGPVPPASLRSLACRKGTALRERRRIRLSTPVLQTRADVVRPRNLVHVQDDWIRYLAEVRACCSPKFWSFYLSLHNQAGVAVDAALSAVKKTFMQPDKNTKE